MRARRWTGLGAAAAVVALAMWAANACLPLAPAEDVPGDASEEAVPPSDTGETILVSDLKVTPDPTNVLIATVTYTTSIPSFGTVKATNTGDKTGINTVSPPADTALATTHTVTLLGLRASSKFAIDVSVTDSAGDSGTGATTYTTAALPAGLPPVISTTTTPSLASVGYLLMTVWKWDGAPVASVDPSGSYLLAVDVAGQVVWYQKGIDMPGMYPVDAQQTADGNILYLTGDSGWAKVDLLGNVLSTGTAASLGLDSLHDSLLIEDTGSFLGLSTKLKQVSGYPVGGGPGGPVDGGVTLPVVGDVVDEFTADGGVTSSWSTFSMMSPYVEGDFFDQGTWNALYPDAGATKDWTHSTSARPGLQAGTYFLSSAAQSWILQFSGASGAPQVAWRLGPGGDFTLTTPNDTFQFNQTGFDVLANGDILCFDAGTFRVTADGGVPALYSRAVEFALDTSSKTATIAWQYQETPPYYSSFLGGATLTDGTNVIVTDGGETANRIAGDPTDPTNLKTARVFEVTHDVTPTKVFEVDVSAPLGSIAGDPSFSGYSVSKVRRMTSFY